MAKSPGFEIHYLASTLEPVPTDSGFSILPTKSFDDCPRLSVICVPGGYRATSHWVRVDQLALLGATPTFERVTSGIDFALVLVAQICGRDVAEQIQLGIEYHPRRGARIRNCNVGSQSYQLSPTAPR